MKKNANKKITVYEVWSPALAMVLFIKLHLPLRTYQVRFLDSGEADTWRYQNKNWEVNTTHRFIRGSTQRPYAKGVFDRIENFGDELEPFSTGLYISTNKTADRNKDEVDRGYAIPWQHDEVLYWLEKLRNWQEKYNPISAPISAMELKNKHFGSTKCEYQKSGMGDFCFLFRSGDGKNHPIKTGQVSELWYDLLDELQKDLTAKGETFRNGSPIQLVHEYPDGSKESGKLKTLFPLHSLRVSLITSYVKMTTLPLPVISKLLAGHSRLLMTIYYCKFTPSFMTQQMKEAQEELEEQSDISLSHFLEDADFNKIESMTAYHDFKSIQTALTNRSPIGWENRVYGMCLVGGNTSSIEHATTLGGCFNGGTETAANNHKIHLPVPHGPENCVRCRWFVTDASHLPALIAHLNQLSYKAHETASLANQIEAELDKMRDEQYTAQEQGLPFSKQVELQKLERRHDKQRVNSDEYVKDYIATFNLIQRLCDTEKERLEGDNKQKMVTVGSDQDLEFALKLTSTDSELLQLSLLCEDAEIFPDMMDSLRKTPAIHQRNEYLSRMISKSENKPLFMEMDAESRFFAANAMMRKMAQLAHSDKIEGYRIAANHIETEEYLVNAKLLDAGMQALAPLNKPQPHQLLKKTETA